MDVEPAPPATFDEAIADICFRFLSNFPKGELATIDRLFFQIQQAHWYYCDFYVDEYNHLPHLNMWEFTRIIFEKYPLLTDYKDSAGKFLTAFKSYLHSIPVYGGILLNSDLTKVLLVRGYSGNSWGFPKGKINQNEAEIDCAAREIYEETGFQARHLMNQVDFVSYNHGEQTMKLFIVSNVPLDFNFAPIARKEVSEVKFWNLSDLPMKRGDKNYNRFWAIREFLRQLFLWIARRKNLNKKRAKKIDNVAPNVMKTDKKITNKTKSNTKVSNKKKSNIASTNDDQDPLSMSSLLTPLEDPAEFTNGKRGKHASGSGKWSVEEMFKTNEKLLKVKYIYDGNSHHFGDEKLRAVPLSKFDEGDDTNTSISTTTAITTQVTTSRTRFQFNCEAILAVL
jgi:8-oxo-dGTP pyrophosphatase MutT (NUDIX family)